MTVFIILAAILTVAAAALVVVPLIKGNRDTPRARWAALMAAATIAVGAAVLYGALSNWHWKAAEPPTTPQAMVANLARRLERNPDDLNGWLMLGRSYTVLGQFPLATRAYQRADRLASGKNVDAIVGMGEALVLEREEELDGRAGKLFEQALALDPKSGKALFYGAAAALRRGELALARQRFAGLLALGPPANIKPILQAQIDSIDRQLAGPSATRQ
jgi:cytochrome c-type biogenesis protein CcmH